jgi:hypothetical protein
MNLFRCAMVCAALLLAGCSFIDGVSVRIRPDKAGIFRSQLEAYLRSKGFTSGGSRDDGGFALEIQHRSGAEPRIGLFAECYTTDGSVRFFVGKGNTHEFSRDEIALVDDCVAFLVANSPMILDGSASDSSTSSPARSAFYAHIKKA